MNWLIDLQHWLYMGMGAGLKPAGDVAALPAMLASAILFGALHALMPGHGKSVLVSYPLGDTTAMTPNGPTSSCSILARKSRTTRS